MDIRFPDKRCLTPRLLDANGATTTRLEGVLDTADDAVTTRAVRLVDAVDYDGRRCRHRVVGGGREPVWLTEDDAHAFRSYARLVVDRLRLLGRDGESCPRRFPDGPPSRTLGRSLERLRRSRGRCALTVLDTCVTADGRLWLRGAIEGARANASESGIGARADEHRLEGWWLLADPPREQRLSRTAADRDPALAPAGAVAGARDAAATRAPAAGCPSLPVQAAIATGRSPSSARASAGVATGRP